MGEHAIAWVAERFDSDDGFMASGRFSAHVEIGVELGDELEDASLEDALAWARARSDRVLIRLADGDYYSAGRVNPDPDEYDEWVDPPEPPSRRRLRGLEMLDNTEDDPPVPWDVRFHVSWVSDRKLLAEVLRDDRTRPAPPDEHADAYGARVLIDASTVRQARAIADEIMSTYRRAVPRRRVALSYEVYPFAPDAPVLFGGFRRTR